MPKPRIAGGFSNATVDPRIPAMMAKMRQEATGFVYVNCWHMNLAESMAMWKLYARSNEAVAIRSTFRRLVDEVPDGSEVFAGTIKYVDFERETIPEGNMLYPFTHKRLSFEHEREVRLVWFSPLLATVNEREGSVFPAGIPLPIDIDRLIESVYVAPTASTWFRELIERVLSRYGSRLPVVQSALDAQPVY